MTVDSKLNGINDLNTFFTSILLRILRPMENNATALPGMTA
jgi:hypothetical protein